MYYFLNIVEKIIQTAALVLNQLPLFAPVDLTFCFAPPGFELVFINFEPPPGLI
jgi:hypothetical protein